jgi:hypothetical protein
MSAEITPVEALHESITELIEETECSLFEVVGVLEVVKTETTLASLADEIEAEGEFESDGVVGE